MMHVISPIAVAIVAVVSAGIMPGVAQARDYPFCIKGSDYEGGLGYCNFDTYQQCLDTASGRFAFCDRNPFYASGAPNIAHPRKRSGQR